MVILLFLICFSQQAFAKPVVLKDSDIINQANKIGSSDPYLVLAIAKKESSKRVLRVPTYEPDGSKTYGLMQLKRGTAKMFGFSGSTRRLYNWRTNLAYGSKYLEYQYKRYNSDIRDTMAAYNAGTAIVCKYGWYTVKRKGKKIKRKCTIGNYINQTYVDEAWKKYVKILKSNSMPIPRGHSYTVAAITKPKPKRVKPKRVKPKRVKPKRVKPKRVKPKRPKKRWRSPQKRIKIMIDGVIIEIDRDSTIEIK